MRDAILLWHVERSAAYDRTVSSLMPPYEPMFVANAIDSRTCHV